LNHIENTTSEKGSLEEKLESAKQGNLCHQLCVGWMYSKGKGTDHQMCAIGQGDQWKIKAFIFN